MAIILDGKTVAASVYQKLLLDISLLGKIPKLVVVLVGEDGASQTYVKMKTRKCLELGLSGETLMLSADTTEEVLLQKIAELNQDPEVDGILVQLPLPRSINRLKVIRSLDPMKDVDGLHPDNLGRILQGDGRYIPCTPQGIIEMLHFYKIPIAGKKAVVIGRSEIVGKPIAQLLLAQDATVTICHSKTQDIRAHTRSADILVVAAGKPKLVQADWIKPGAVVIDVGIHRTDGGIVGDVDFESILPVASAISPVPGGVGPMTIAMLMRNVVLAASLK